MNGERRAFGASERVAVDGLTAITPANNAESKQITKAKKSLVAAQAALECAILREANPKAACP